MRDMNEEAEAEKRADEIFDNLDDYSRGSLALHGTAFTTYEDEGDQVCKCLERRARAWRASLKPA